ncbi:MAG: hypothetical protein K1X72_27615 [Pyrinomonadaceae bacterium]|nr:hypothetical protein [Pyrinomonadaceae bacterium]
MKQCPQCRQNFADDIHFCLSDGTPLVWFDDAPEEITVIKQIPKIQFPVQTPVQPPIQPIPPKSFPFFTCLSALAAVLLIGIGGLLLGIFVLRGISNRNTNSELSNDFNKPFPKNDNSVNKIDDQIANLKKQKDQIEKEKQKLANERQKLEEDKNKVISTPTPLSTPTINYPPQPTVRIKFGRGRVAESVTGVVYKERSFVLEARNGQYLSASVNGGNCVRFSNGSTTIGFVTSSGDNRLNIVNACNSEANFTLTVSIR